MANSEAAKDLLRELVEEILSFLPVRSLLRFRCLSKSWRDTISSPSFRLSTRIRQRSVILLEHSTICSPPFDTNMVCLIEVAKEGLAIRSDFDLPTFLASSYMTDDYEPGGTYHDGILLLGSYNGLLLLGYQGFIFLFNPSIRQCTKISPYRVYRNRFVCGGMCYDPSHNDYKFVLSIQPQLDIPYMRDDDGACNVQVISFKRQTREVVKFPYQGIDWNSSMRGVVVDEKIHWIVYAIEGYSPLLLVSFNPANNGFVEVPMPEHPELWGNICGLGVLDGCLAMSTRRLCARDERRLIFHVWVMKEYGVKESWTLLLTLEIPLDDIKGYPVIFNCCRPLFITSYGEVVINLGPGRMIAYDLKDNRYREIVLPHEACFIRCAIAYEESLVSPFTPTPRSYKEQFKV